LLLALLVPIAARAQTRCPAPRGMEAVATVDAEERLRFLDAALKHASKQSAAWAWSWVGIYSALATYNILWATVNADQDKRIDGAVGAFGSLVGLAVIAVLPPKAIGDEWKFSRMRRQKVEICALIAEGEKMLVRDADGEEFGHSALVHAGNIAFNAVLGGVLAGVFHHTDQAAITALVGTAIGEIQTLTCPSPASKSLERYRSGDLAPVAEKPARAFGLVPRVSREGHGTTLSLGFTLAF